MMYTCNLPRKPDAQLPCEQCAQYTMLDKANIVYKHARAHNMTVGFSHVRHGKKIIYIYCIYSESLARVSDFSDDADGSRVLDTGRRKINVFEIFCRQ